MRENLAGAERARARGDGAGAARRCGAHAQLRRGRPARDLRRPRVLRQGRVRGPAHDGHADGGQALRRARSRVRSRSRRPQAPAAQERTSARKRSRSRRAPTSRSTCRCSRRRSSAHASPRASRSTRSRATSTRPRCSATSGSSAPRRAASRTTTSSRRGSGRRCARSSTSRARKGCSFPPVAWGYFPVNSEGDALVVWKDDTRTPGVAALRVPAPAQGAVPLHRRLLPARRVGRARLRRRSTS